MAKAVIFDRDGVILDSESINVNSAVKAFERLGIHLPEDQKPLIVGRPPEEYLGSFLQIYSFEKSDFFREQAPRYSSMMGSAPFFRDTVGLVRCLRENNIPTALTTSSCRDSTEKVLKRGGLENAFNVVVSFGDYTQRKPNPEPYLVTARKLGLRPRECVVIEDSLVGLKAAKNAGMKCIVIPNDYTRGFDFSIADKVVESANDLSLDLLRII